MTTSGFTRMSLVSLSASLLLAGALTIAPTPSRAGCFGCGFDVGIGIGGLALGALAAGAVRSNEPQYDAQTPRQRGGRPPVVSYDPSDPEAPRTAPAQRRASSRKAVAQKPADTPRKVASVPVAETGKKTRSVAVASSGALEP